LKKRSAAKPPEIVFFIDRSFGKIDLPDALRAAGYDASAMTIIGIKPRKILCGSPALRPENGSS